MKIIITFIIVVVFHLILILFREYLELDNNIDFIITFLLVEVGLGLFVLFVYWLADGVY